MSTLPSVLQVDAETPADKALIGGKAASLVTLAKLGARVPPAFVLTTEAYRQWATNEESPEFVEKLIDEGLSELESRTSRKAGSGPNGLIVSVRSGAPVSMPGMMDTVLNAGLGSLDEGLDPSVYDARARFLLQFAEVVVGLEEDKLAAIREQAGDVRNAEAATQLETVLTEAAAAAGYDWPESARQELIAAAQAVFGSWNTKRAKLYRRMRKIDDDLGTSVTIQQMVFGNRDENSGSGVAFTRNPSTGAPGLHGEFLVGGQGEEVVAGQKTAAGLAHWRERQPALYDELDALGKQLEVEFKKVHEIEFTVESGDHYILQCRPALLTPQAAACIAVDMVEEGLIDHAQALEYAAEHGFDINAEARGLAVKPDAQALGKGLAVGGGVATGRVALSADKLREFEQAGEPVVFITVETSPNLLSAMHKAAALVTMRGGESSHAAVVARQIGTPCVVGVGAEIADGRLALGAGLAEGDWATVDGNSGEIFEGDVTHLTEKALSRQERDLRQWANQGKQEQHAE